MSFSRSLKYFVLLGTIFQKRGFGNGGTKFQRDWEEYKHGFVGDNGEEFWLGNDRLHELTKAGDMMLRVELEAWDGRTAWAEYDTFRSDL